MRPFLAFLLLCLVGLGLSVETRADEDEARTPGAASPREVLVGPIALYPDIVLSALLPATTEPRDLRAAISYVQGTRGDMFELPSGESWSPAVLALLQYPRLLRWLGENAAWTAALGHAVAVQPLETLQAIQQYRRRVWYAGRLDDTRFQKVISNTTGAGVVFEVLPADPIHVHLPAYDATRVATPTTSSPFAASGSGLRWDAGMRVGAFGAWTYHAIHWSGARGAFSVFDRPQHALRAGGRQRRLIGGSPWQATRPGQLDEAQAPAPTPPTWTGAEAQGDAVRAPLDAEGAMRPGEASAIPAADLPRSRHWYSGHGFVPDVARGPEDHDAEPEAAEGSSTWGRRAGVQASRLDGRTPRTGRSRGTGQRTRAAGGRSKGSATRTRGSGERTPHTATRDQAPRERTPRATSYWDWRTQQRARAHSRRGWQSRNGGVR